MASLRRLSVILLFGCALAVAPACSSDHLSTAGQLIQCDVAADGTTSNCHPTDSATPAGADQCTDVDEDGDDDPDDVSEAEGSDDSAVISPSEGDDDGDGTPDEADTDDDNDGIPDDVDCDELPGGQDAD